MDGIEECQAYAELIKDNLDFDVLVERYPYQEKELQNIYDIILETVVAKGESVIISGQKYPRELVKAKFLKFNMSHKLYALGDYYLSGAISEHSRHIYDVYKLLEIVPLDDKLKALAKEVYIEREPHEQCRSAKPWVEMNKLLQEIIDVEAYKKDYEDITMKMLFEKIDYETAASKLQQVVAHGLFE